MEKRALLNSQAAATRSGLASRGVLRLEPSERIGVLASTRSLLLLGMVGAEQWLGFATSPEALDGLPHPLDRWSRRVVGALAEQLGVVAIYPFEGPPYWPFQAWARRAEPLSPSPLGLLIHPSFGLWHGYRGALAFETEIDAPAFDAAPGPCESCIERPCLDACPVGAFSSAGYDVAACAAHLAAPAGRDCMENGCRARRACPIGREHAHSPEQARFHMRAFFEARTIQSVGRLN